MTDLVERLQDVVVHGEPAQATRARELLDALGESPRDASRRRDAELLLDAYLNDPYLTR